MAFIPVQRPVVAPIGPMLGGQPPYGGPPQGPSGWGQPPPVIQPPLRDRFAGPGMGPAPAPAIRGPYMGSMKKGGKVKKTGMYQLHKGEEVVPLSVFASHPVPRTGEANKLEQAIVLYMNAETLGSQVGAHCGDCWKFIGSEKGKGKCIEVDGEIDPAHGVCGLYVNGRVFDGRKPDFEVVHISKAVAGYFEKGPTHCETCEYFVRRGLCRKVSNSPQTIEEAGCCNAYEPNEEED